MTPEQLLRHYDHASFWSQPSGLDVDTAYAQALAVRQLRIGRGEKARGYKVGFTNRNIWPKYGVHAPIWGTMYETTVAFCEGRGEVAVTGMCQPRIEPECVFGIAATPPAEPTLDQLLACIEWVAPGFEIVQSHLPNWKFGAGDAVADGALHAWLLVGRRMPAGAMGADAAVFEKEISSCSVVLRQDGRQVDDGAGANVLDGPLHALRHFLHELRNCPGAPDLVSGDVVTTGTWTDAWPVTQGETWVAEFAEPFTRLEVLFR